jgi:hypothetical protein
MKKLSSLFKRPKNWSTLIIIMAVIAILGLIIAISLRKNDTNNTFKPGKTLSPAEASAKAEEFINNFLMPSGSIATVKEVTSEYNLYKLSVDITSDVVESYLSKDGRLFFPQSLNIDEITTESLNAVSNTPTPTATVSNKNDKPVLELFTMSHCPYGTQIEKGILPVWEILKDKIDFKIKFNTYAMHGEIELKEQLNQYCIQKEQTAKFADYLACFLEEGNSENCLVETNINKRGLETCIEKTDKEFSIIDNFQNQVGYQGGYPGFDVFKTDNLKYGVEGSPTLVINSEVINSARDSASLLATICSAFTEAPEECSTILPSATPSTGFGYNTTAATSNASCE